MRSHTSINIHDSSLGIWQDNPNDKTLRSEVYAVLIRDLRARGWSIHANPETRKRFRILSPNQRLGALGTLRCHIEVTGRVVKIEFWSETAPQINSHGRYYDFDKLKRMSKLDRLRVELEFRRITQWLASIAPITVTRRDAADLSPMERIAKGYAESWHSDKELGRPVCTYDYNRKSKDGQLLEHGQTVWFSDHSGRIMRGRAYYNINSMWWVVAGGRLFNESCRTIYASVPADLRVKRNERSRRNRLERELQIAVQRMDYQRAQTLKTIIFGTEQTYMIWARDHKAYYRSQYTGCASDSAHAGKYTRAEAEAECRRVPHELEMVCPDGKHISFDKKAA